MGGEEFGQSRFVDAEGQVGDEEDGLGEVACRGLTAGSLGRTRLAGLLGPLLCVCRGDWFASLSSSGSGGLKSKTST